MSVNVFAFTFFIYHLYLCVCTIELGQSWVLMGSMSD